MSEGELQVILSDEIRDEISIATNGGTSDFYKGYEIVNREISAGNIEVDADTAYWFENAKEINENNPFSSSNAFIRSVTIYGFEYDDQEYPDTQVTSDAIGEQVIRNIIDFGIPKFDDLVRTDINTALNLREQDLSGWGGSFYYWNTEIDDETGETVGDTILREPERLEKFLTVTASAVRASLLAACRL